jgi:hypothetical protein
LFCSNIFVAPLGLFLKILSPNFQKFSSLNKMFDGAIHPNKKTIPPKQSSDGAISAASHPQVMA